jgi:FkbM family methyltransferase
MDNTIYKVDTSDKPLYFHVLKNCVISNIIKSNVIWEPHLHIVFEKYINKNSIVIECGCHIGTHTVKLASLCDKIYGFEPMPETYEILTKNMLINNIDNAILYKLGVSNKPGVTKYSWISENNPGASGLENNPMGKPTYINATSKNIDVNLTTIDLLSLNKLDFIKIDVEGYERLVIEGAMNTIKRCKPIIVMEIWKDHFGGVDINYTKELFKNLIDIGYTIVQISGPDFLFTPN